MTREEKVNLLNKLLEIEQENDIGNLTRANRREFQEWAIKASEQEPYEKFESVKDHVYKLAGDYKCWDNRLTEDEAVELCHILEQEPSEDCVSRAKLLKMYENRFIELQKAHQIDKQLGVNWCINTLKELPSVTSQPKTGHWITQWNGVHQKEYYYCSECREEFSYDGETGIKMNDYDFCPNCGADMREETINA